MRRFLLVVLLISLALSVFVVVLPSEKKDHIRDFLSGEEELSPSDPIVSSRLSYTAGDLSPGLLYDYGEEETVLVFCTDQLKANTQYKISWEFDSQYINDAISMGAPSVYTWYIPRSDDGKYYFMYQPSYAPYESGFNTLITNESDSLLEAEAYFTSGAEGDQFVFATLRLNLPVEDAEKGYLFILDYVKEIVIEEVV